MTDPRTPPHSREAEENLIACCLIDGAEVDSSGALTYPTLKRAIEAGVTAADFYFPLTSRVFGVLGELQKAGRPANGDALIIEVSGKASPEDVYAMLALGDPTKNPTTAHAGFFIEKVRECADKRTAIRNATAIVEGIYSGVPLAELSGGAVFPPAMTGKNNVLKDLLSRRVTSATPPKEPVTRLYLADKPIATPGNLQTITAKSKTGKTVATGAATAAVLVATTGTASLRDTFKFRASNPQGHAVIIIDTEQSPYDAWTCYQRILARAGEQKDPPWLLHFALVGYSVAKRKAALSAALEYAKKTFGGVFLVIIDGVAHFVTSVNEIEECNAMADWLRELSVTYDTAILCVIHANEGEKSGDDSRGHLGKQLMRDAESNLLLRKIGAVTTITSEKQRKAPITEADAVAFQWSDEHQYHVSCEAGTNKRGAGRKKLHSIHEFLDVIPRKGQPAKSASQLHRYANELKEIKLQTFKDLLTDAVKDGVLLRTYDDKTGFSYIQSL